MMNTKKGIPFSIPNDNEAIPGCTTSTTLWHTPYTTGTCFSLAPHTDISAETYGEDKVLYIAKGSMLVSTPSTTTSLTSGNTILIPKDTPFAIKTDEGAIYIELYTKEATTMNLDGGKIYQLAELVPCQEDKIINRDIIASKHVKLALMAFGEGTGLTEHAAPGEALVMALEGKAIITYEGVDHAIKAGESFVFEKGGRHAVKADGPFKMALLLTLE